jgi:phosphoribosylformylglycinamidine synthase PurS subunit
MRFQVLVRLKSGVLDVQGKAIETGLKDKHFEAFKNVRVGRVIELDVDGVAAAEAREQVNEVCKLLLANPVIEEYEIKEVA